ncbi:MAG: Uma2 family endonuclease [Bacteroidota bacterium]
MSSTLDKIKQDPALPQLIEEINDFWAKEQTKRKAYYEIVHEDVKAEFINGEIIYQSPVKSKHWKACTRISARLSIYVDEKKLGIVGAEKVMIRCTRNDYEPDVVFFSNEKAKDFQPNQMVFPPCDLAVEVLSESTKKNDYGVKFEDYAAHGIIEYWIVDADEESVEQYLLKDQAYHLHQKLTKSGVLKSTVVEGFEMEIGIIFS